MQADEEGECHDDSCEGTTRVVGWCGEGEVEVGEERGYVGHEDGTHSKDGVDEAFVDEGVNTARFEEGPGCLFLLVNIHIYNW